ncbi:MAG: YHS domain-containing protein [Desulfosarcinaceae bacterium]|nr:YHS domain-containing protein [Desulfosarcinaceae bacterium]
MKRSQPSRTVIDPVCQMKVVMDGDVPAVQFRSNTYHFCANACREAFVADPERYLSTRPPKRKGFWGRYLERLNKATGGKPPCCH